MEIVLRPGSSGKGMEIGDVISSKGKVIGDSVKKFFIVGCPRSGTTMLQQALNRHSQIVIPPETKYFFSFFGHPLKQQRRHLRRINADLGIDLPQPSRRIRSLADGRDYYDAMVRQYVERHNKPGVAYFGEKTPEHTGLLPNIRQLYPDAKIIILERDGRDVASSLTRVPWMSSNLYANFMVWLYYHRVIQREKSLGRPNVYFARYEEIVAHPRRELKAVLDFLDAPYEPAVAQGHGNREGVPERELLWKDRALQPITPQRAGAFSRELTREQIETLESLGKEPLLSLGYPLLCGGKRALSSAFFLTLGVNLARLAYQLPWGSVLRELVCRVVREEPFDNSPSPSRLPALLATLREKYSSAAASPGVLQPGQRA